MFSPGIIKSLKSTILQSFADSETKLIADLAKEVALTTVDPQVHEALLKIISAMSKGMTMMVTGEFERLLALAPGDPETYACITVADIPPQALGGRKDGVSVLAHFMPDIGNIPFEQLSAAQLLGLELLKMVTEYSTDSVTNAPTSRRTQ